MARIVRAGLSTAPSARARALGGKRTQGASARSGSRDGFCTFERMRLSYEVPCARVTWSIRGQARTEASDAVEGSIVGWGQGRTGRQAARRFDMDGRPDGSVCAATPHPPPPLRPSSPSFAHDRVRQATHSEAIPPPREAIPLARPAARPFAASQLVRLAGKWLAWAASKRFPPLRPLRPGRTTSCHCLSDCLRLPLRLPCL